MLNITNVLYQTDVKQCQQQKIIFMINSKFTKEQRRDLWNKSYWGSDWSGIKDMQNSEARTKKWKFILGEDPIGEWHQEHDENVREDAVEH